MMSKAELARKSGLSTLTIDRVEAGRPCRLDTKRKILQALQLRVDDQDRIFSAPPRKTLRTRRRTARPKARDRAWPEAEARKAVKLSLPNFGSKSIIGLDIGSSSVKAVEISKKGKSKDFELTHLGVAPLPPEAIVQGAFLNSSAIVDAIREAVEKAKIKTKHVAAAVSGHSVIVKRVSLPAMTREELDEQIRWEAEQYIPFDVNEVNLDFQILDDEGGEGQMDVLLVAAKKDLIDDYVQVITEAGLTPAVIDVAAFAVENAYEANYDVDPGRGGGAGQHRGAGREHQRRRQWRSDLHARHHDGRQPVHRGDPEGALHQLRGSRADQARRPPRGREPGGGPQEVEQAMQASPRR